MKGRVDFFFLLLFSSNFTVMRSTQKERVKPGEHAGDTGTRSCVRATASVLQERDEKKRPGWSWGGRGKRETVRLPPPTPGKHLQALDPAPHLPWSPRGPSLVLLLAPVALSFATSLVLLFWGVFFFWFSLVFLFLIWFDLFSPDRFRLGTHFEGLA